MLQRACELGTSWARDTRGWRHSPWWW
uniref:Uncharacterized protein n=1 Tax=Arundo donax TaxID=35708 RepID=A0A0A9AR31_ARUDO